MRYEICALGGGIGIRKINFVRLSDLSLDADYEMEIGSD
jgi:hypothetical protein